jgi:hypothetical protein
LEKRVHDRCGNVNKNKTLIESEEAVEEDSPAITPPKKERTQKTRPSNRRKAAE